MVAACGAVRLGCRVSKFVYCGVLDPRFTASLLVPRSRLVADRDDWVSPLACGGGQLQACCLQQVLLASLQTEVKTRRRSRRRGAVAAYVWTMYEMACFFRPSCDRCFDLSVACSGQDYSEGASDSVLRRRCGGLGLTCCEHAATSFQQSWRTAQKTVEFPQVQFSVWLSCPSWCNDWGYGPDSAELFGGGVQFLDKVVDVRVAVHVVMLRLWGFRSCSTLTGVEVPV